MRHKTAFPMWEYLGIELTSMCNRNCEWCSRYLDRSGVRKDARGNKIDIQAPTEKIYHIIDQAAGLGYKKIVTFHGFSEPLLDPRYIEFARYAQEKGMVVEENTNGDILNARPELCAALDGVVDSFIIGLYDYKNEAEKQAEMARWKKKFMKSKVYFSIPQEVCLLKQNSKIYGEWVKKNPSLLDKPCFRLGSFCIRYDGNVQLCTEDDRCEFGLGNAFEQSLEEIWWSDRHIEMFKTLKNPGGRRCFEFCSKCYIDLICVDYNRKALVGGEPLFRFWQLDDIKKLDFSYLPSYIRSIFYALSPLLCRINLDKLEDDCSKIEFKDNGLQEYRELRIIIKMKNKDIPPIEIYASENKSWLRQGDAQIIEYSRLSDGKADAAINEMVAAVRDCLRGSIYE